MLDQNTDRMWFVIGAVIVGAAIIFIANGSLPTLFASVADTFEGASEASQEVIGDIHPNTNEFPDGLRAYRGAQLNFRNYPEILVVRTTGNNDGVYFDSNQYEADSVYELTFEFKRTAGELLHMNGHAQGFWDDSTYYLDGVEHGSWHNSYATGLKQNINDDAIHHARIVVETKGEDMRHYRDVFYNNHLHIQPNRSIGSPAVEVEIYNMTLEKVE